LVFDKNVWLGLFCSLASLDTSQISGKGHHRNWLEDNASFGYAQCSYNRRCVLFPLEEVKAVLRRW